MVVGILFLQAVAFAVLSGIVANNKNRDPAGWSVLGFLFGLFGFIAAIAVSEAEPNEENTSRRKKSESSSTREFNPDEHEKKCPACAEYVKLEARVCRYCGYEFSDEEIERQIEQKREEVERREQDEPSGSLENVLATHDFNNSDTCNKCGVSMAYAENSRYECPS